MVTDSGATPNEVVLSLYAKGLTTGEISAHFAEIYGASVSKETINRITDKVIEEMNEWAARLLDETYAAFLQLLFRQFFGRSAVPGSHGGVMDDIGVDDRDSAARCDVDVVVIGGGSAGLSGALTLARSRRSVVVLDAGAPRNRPAAGIHGLLTREGMAPRDFVGEGAAEVQRYGGQIVSGRAVSVARAGRRFLVHTEDGGKFTAARLLVATGLVDELPAVAGLGERWGRDVLHCPYCHGWEVRDQPIGVLGSGPGAVHQTLLFRQWSAELTLFVHTAPALTKEQGEQLAARGVSVVTGQVAGLEITGDELAGVRMTSGEIVPVRALVVSPRFVAQSAVLAELGLAPVQHPAGLGSYLESDLTGQTVVPGVWVAGNVADLAAGVVQSAAAGVSAAAAINADLVAADTAEAVQRHRDPFRGASEARVTERVLGDRRHGLGTRL